MLNHKKNLMLPSAEELKVKALALINKHQPFFIEELCYLMGISKFTFYDRFPINSPDYNDIKDALGKVKYEIKKKLRTRWATSDKPVESIALYKVIANNDELRALNGVVIEKEDEADKPKNNGLDLSPDYFKKSDSTLVNDNQSQA